VGFSHAEKGQTVSTTELAAIDVAAFVDIVCPPLSLIYPSAFMETPIDVRLHSFSRPFQNTRAEHST